MEKVSFGDPVLCDELPGIISVGIQLKKQLDTESFVQFTCCFDEGSYSAGKD